MKKFRIKVTFTEEILGTVPMNKEVYSAFIKSLGKNNDDELESLVEREEGGWTTFHRIGGEPDGKPFLYDYVVKGFLKAACGFLRRSEMTYSKKFTAYKRVIDGLVFVEERQIPLILPPDGKIGVCERPLRASTAQGERVALARSDTCPPGTTMEFTLLILGAVYDKLLKEWLDYGAFHGFGQWRNSGKGRFTYTLEKIAGDE